MVNQSKMQGLSLERYSANEVVTLGELIGEYWNLLFYKMPISHLMYLESTLRTLYAKKDHNGEFSLVNRNGQQLLKSLGSISSEDFLLRGSKAFSRFEYEEISETSVKREVGLLDYFKYFANEISFYRRYWQKITDGINPEEWARDIENEDMDCIDAVTLNMLAYFNLQQRGQMGNVLYFNPVGYTSQGKFFSHYGNFYFKSDPQTGKLELNLMVGGGDVLNTNELRSVEKRSFISEGWYMYQMVKKLIKNGKIQISQEHITNIYEALEQFEDVLKSRIKEQNDLKRNMRTSARFFEES